MTTTTDEIARLRQEVAALEHSIEVRRAAVAELTTAYESIPEKERARFQRWKGG